MSTHKKDPRVKIKNPKTRFGGVALSGVYVDEVIMHEPAEQEAKVIPLHPEPTEMPAEVRELLMSRYKEVFSHVKDAVVSSLNAMQMGIDVDILAEHCHTATVAIMNFERRVEDGTA